jgi:hypothetical protein
LTLDVASGFGSSRNAGGIAGAALISRGKSQALHLRTEEGTEKDGIMGI